MLKTKPCVLETMFKSLILLLSLLFATNVVEGQITLESVSIIIRHGDRAPITFYPNDTLNSDEFWPNGAGNLIDKGYDRSAQSAQLIAQELARLFDGDANFTISDQVFTSPVNRTQVTADEFMKNFRSDPVYKLVIDEKMLKADASCPKSDQLQTDIFTSSMVKQYLENKTELIKQVSQKVGEDWLSAEPEDIMWKMGDLWDTLQIELNEYPDKVPEWAKDASLLDGLLDFQKRAFYWNFDSAKIQRLRAGLFLKDIRDKMSDKNQSIQFRLYSSHDTVQVAIFQALGLKELITPKYLPTYNGGLSFKLYANQSDGSNQTWIMFTYYEFPNIPGKMTITMTQQNLIPEPCANNTPIAVANVNGDQVMCTWEQFTEIILAEMIPDDWDEECKLNGSPSTIQILSRTTILVVGFVALKFNAGWLGAF